MNKVNIVYYSFTGNTLRMVKAFEKGLQEASVPFKSYSVVELKDDNEAMALSNAYAPEHLIIATCNYNELATKVINAGSVFLGKYACESAGDYASGTNHTLPTHGYARAYSGVNLDSYQRKITFQQLDEAGITSIGRAVEAMAEAELKGLEYEMNRPETQADPVRSHAVAEAYAAKEIEIMQRYEKWEQLTEA